MANDDDSDVSAITLSDDDEPKTKAAGPPKAAPKPTSAAVGNGRAGATDAGDRGKLAAKVKRGKGRVAFQLQDDENYDDGDDAGGADGDERSYGYGDDGEADNGGAVEDETKPLGWSYFRKRDASEGPATWAEVDVGELRFVAENLVRSTTKRASQADDVMQQIFQAAPGDEDSLVPDPLGRGVIDPVTLTLGKRSKMKAAKLAQPSNGEKGLKATMRTFRTARLSTKQQQQQKHQVGGEGAGGSGQAASAAGLDEETRKVLPNQEGFNPEAYLATFHSESGLTQLEKGLRSLSRELSERTGQLKLLIRNNFDRFINCKDAIDDIHAKMRKTLVRGTGAGTAGGGGAPPALGAGGSAAASLQLQQQQQQVATDRVFRSLEQVEGQARRTFGPILERAAKADRIRAVASLLQRFDHLFAAPQRVMELAGRGELEQVVREYKRANMLIRPTPTTARVWVSLFAEIEKRVTEVYLAVKQLVTEPPPEDPPMGQDGPPALPGTGTTASVAPDAVGSADDVARQRLALLPDYLLFLALVRQERLPAAREEDPMRLYVSRLETHVVARIQTCDKQHTEQLGQLVGAWLRATTGGGASFASSTTTPAAAALRSASSSIAALQASFTALPRMDSAAAAGPGRVASGVDGRGKAAEATGGGGGSDARGADAGSEDDRDSLEVDDLEEEGEAAETAFLLWQGAPTAASSAFVGTVGSLPYHIRTELRRLVQEPGGTYGGAAAAEAAPLGFHGGGGVDEPLPSSNHAPAPHLTCAQRQWVSYVCSVSALLLWALPGMWATCNSPKYGNNADLTDESRESLERGPSLARKLVESLCTKYATRLRRAVQSLARAGALQPGLPLIIKDGCHLWSALRRVGIPARTLSSLRGAVLGALGVHVRVLDDHMAGLPELLFGADDFRLDLLAADQQPVTALPRRLEEEVGVVLLHYQWPLVAVVEAAGSVTEVPQESSWRPMQSSVFACFSVLSEALAEYARGLYETGKDGRGSFRSKPSGSLDSDGSSAGGAPGGNPAGSSSPGAGYRRAAAVVGSGVGSFVGSPLAGVGASRRRVTDTSDGGAADGTPARSGSGGSGLWGATGGSGGGSDDVRVLLVIGNSAVIRTRVLPGLVERYRKLLAPTSEAGALCQRRLRELTSAMRRSNEALGSSYLGRKEADVEAAVKQYMAAAVAPLLPDAASASASAVSGPPSSSSSSKSRGAKTAFAAPAAALLPGPTGPSAGCCSLLQLLTAIHNEALAYSPSNLLSFMEALAERLVGALAPACRGMAAKAGAEGKGASAGPSVEQLVQMWADLRFLTAALRPLLARNLAAEFGEAKVDVAEAIAARQRARRYRPLSAPAAALMDLNEVNGPEVDDALEELLAADVNTWLALHALNVRCFATAASPPTGAGSSGAGGAAAATASASQAVDGAKGGKGEGGAQRARVRDAESSSPRSASAGRDQPQQQARGTARK